jgi:hypothetical protein
MRLAGFAALSASALLLCAAAAAAAPIAEGVMALIPFDHSPFPYDGIVPETGLPFLDVAAGGRRGHASPRGGVYWEAETYSDRRSLILIPDGFDPARAATIVVFFHGNEATLERDVMGRQEVPAQLARSGLNAVLVAPQFAFNALDSSAGRFWQPRAFADYMAEAGDRLAELYGDPSLGGRFDRMPVVLIAYSGGYLAAASAISVGAMPISSGSWPAAA